MIPVEQRSRYDCLTACLASIFEEPYEAVPVFCDQETGEPVPRWHGVMDNWLAERGWSWLQRVRTLDDGDDLMRCPWGMPTFWIAGVQSPRYEGEHAIVMQGNKVVWDPHPQREQGHLGFMSCDYFLPLDPARFVLRAAPGENEE